MMPTLWQTCAARRAAATDVRAFAAAAAAGVEDGHDVDGDSVMAAAQDYVGIFSVAPADAATDQQRKELMQSPEVPTPEDLRLRERDPLVAVLALHERNSLHRDGIDYLPAVFTPASGGVDGHFRQAHWAQL